MRFRSLLGVSLVLVVASMFGPGCGGAIAPVAGGDGGGGGSDSGSGGGSGGGSSTGSGGGPGDASVIDSRAPPDGPPGNCQVDGVACLSAAQCCSGVCQGVCGGAAPPCLPDGVSCGNASACCSNTCNGGICGGSVVGCAVSSNANQCDVCLASSCCPQLSSCDSNPNCAQSQVCFDGCYKGPGTGAGCAQKCESQFPSTQATALGQCGASSCIAECN
jgi:hypothetical protein